MADTTEPRGNTARAYEQIRQAIVEGRYLPGQRLIEQRIGEEFELSRTPVREALRRLEAEGLVRSEPNRGATVREITATDIVDLYELRALLESLVAERAATRATDEELALLDRAIAEFEEAVPEDGDREPAAIRRVNAANELFHATLLRAARHSRVAQILDRTVDIPLVFQAFRQFDRDEFERSALFHRLIRNAVAAGDAERARNLMREHILLGRDRLLASLGEYGSVDRLFAAAHDGGRTP